MKSHGLQANTILLVIALSLVVALPASGATTTEQQQSNAFCPPGVAQVSLDIAEQRGAVNSENEVHQHRPALFASPLEFNGPLNSKLSGTWTEDKKTWQICLIAPPMSPSSSLILLLNNLRLPLGSVLEVQSNGGSKENLNSFNDGGSLFTGQKATKALTGNELLLTYTSGRKLGFTSAKQEQSQQQETPSLPKWQPNIEIKAILQSTLPSGNIKYSPTMGFSRSLLSESATKSEEKSSNSSYSQVVSDADSLFNTEIFFKDTIELSTEQLGASVSCFKNAACVPWLDKARRSTVLLMLVSEFGGRFCTGSLINGPRADEQLILTANHCRETDDDVTIASTWGIALENEEPCPPADEPPTAGAAAVRRLLQSDGEAPAEKPILSTKQLIQGLEVVFSDEQSDVMVLKLKNPIPQEYNSYLLGWDASGNTLAPSGSGCVHHPLGDLKKAATSTQPLEKAIWKFSEKTHLKVQWGADGGGTLDGSSGAALVNKETDQILGVLSGGVTAKTCSGNHDSFGSLEHAWDRGLKDVLRPDAVGGQAQGLVGRAAARAATRALTGGRSMPGREYNSPSSDTSESQITPQLVINPPRLVLSESSQPENVAEISLSEAPENGESVHVQVTLSQFPPTASSTGASNEELSTPPPLSLRTETLTFTATDWDSAQPVVIVSGQDTLAEGPLPFQLELKSSLQKSASEKVLLEQRVVQGLRTDEELVPGYSILDPVVINRDAVLGIDVQGQGILEPEGGRNQKIGKMINLKQPLEQVSRLPLGSATYFSLNLSKEGLFNVNACSEEMELQVAVYFNNTATWVSSEPCVSRVSRSCKSTQAETRGCSGFEELMLPSIRFPYTIVVTGTGNGSPAGFYTFDMKQVAKPAQGNSTSNVATSK